MPWCEEVVRLEASGYGAAEIAPRLNRTTQEVALLMESPEYAAQRSANQDRLRFLFEERLKQLWGLSDEVIKMSLEVVQQFRDILADPPEDLRGTASLRRDALFIMKDVLDRIGLKAPDKSEVKITESKTVEDVTSLETYEKRLELVKAYQEAGEVPPPGLSMVDLDG
jgi:hypothetical protein